MPRRGPQGGGTGLCRCGQKIPTRPHGLGTPEPKSKTGRGRRLGRDPHARQRPGQSSRSASLGAVDFEAAPIALGPPTPPHSPPQSCPGLETFLSELLQNGGVFQGGGVLRDALAFGNGAQQSAHDFARAGFG